MKNLTKTLTFSLAMGCIMTSAVAQNNFAKDKEFLQKNTDAVVLSDKSGNSQIVVVPSYQGRVMTSTANGDTGMSFGWMNYDLIASKKLEKHINSFGGEDRFWMGPEGGQFSLYFPAKAPFVYDNWQVPAAFDTETYEIADKTDNSITFKKDFSVTNYSGTKFDASLTRQVNLLDKDKIEQILGVKLPEKVNVVGYETNNKVTNTGKDAWTKDAGLLSIWVLGNYAPSDTAKVYLPINKGEDSKLGPKVIVYESFCKIPKNRLTAKDDVVIFKADGKLRSKIGITPQRAKDVLGSFDAAKNVLTIVKYNKPENETSYVNSLWEMQKNPFGGDALNSYNDGPLGKGLKQLGPFYELETSSPALALAPNESFTHVRYTFHFMGDKKDLQALAKQVFGIEVSGK